ncbi:hypothetical protein AXG93_2035s1000 [Marchantia polymorpha subsp. ruderalis]|uniref:Uncharacterized protein n=1 Tax=Marchantia polymorpha subsp. ruderalis TaxID=1480154 RepID=A0A176VP79_MARPO|nr:hypothetical protein AXG93_2035s1000 [Marchantia polymorpha subsp. ruderalis]
MRSSPSSAAPEAQSQFVRYGSKTDSLKRTREEGSAIGRFPNEEEGDQTADPFFGGILRWKLLRLDDGIVVGSRKSTCSNNLRNSRKVANLALWHDRNPLLSLYAQDVDATELMHMKQWKSEMHRRTTQSLVSPTQIRNHGLPRWMNSHYES